MTKQIIFLLIFSCLCSTVNSQIIRGTVLDEKTKGPVDYALVYFNGTFLATYTDQKGFFELDISDFNSMPLTVK